MPEFEDRVKEAGLWVFRNSRRIADAAKNGDVSAQSLLQMAALYVTVPNDRASLTFYVLAVEALRKEWGE